MRRSWTLPLAAVAACAPSRAYLFDPVATAGEDRIGTRPEWRSHWRRSPEADARIRELLSKPLGSAGAQAIAILNSPALQAAYANLGVAGGEWTSARTPPNPELEAELRFPLEDDGETQIELSATWSVTDLVALVSRADVADAELRAERRRAVALTVDLAARARAAWVEATAAEQTLALRRTIAEAATASATLARSLHDAGNLTDLALTRETLFEEEASLSVREAEAALAAARERVNATLGLVGAETAWRTVGELPDPPASLPALDAFEREAVSASLELEALRWRIQAAGARVGLARLESFPDVGLGVSANREGTWSAGPLFTLSLPIFDWGQGARAAAWSQLRGAQQEYTAAAIELRAAARSARARLAGAHERVTRIRQRVLPLRERLIEESVLQYNAMNLDAFELLIVRREQIEAEERYVSALRDYWLAQTEVDQLRAGSMPRAEEH